MFTSTLLLSASEPSPPPLPPPPPKITSKYRPKTPPNPLYPVSRVKGSVPDTSGAVMRNQGLSLSVLGLGVLSLGVLSLGVLDSVVEEEVDQDGVYCGRGVLAQNLAPQELDTPNATAFLEGRRWGRALVGEYFGVRGQKKEGEKMGEKGRGEDMGRGELRGLEIKVDFSAMIKGRKKQKE